MLTLRTQPNTTEEPPAGQGCGASSRTIFRLSSRAGDRCITRREMTARLRVKRGKNGRWRFRLGSTSTLAPGERCGELCSIDRLLTQNEVKRNCAENIRRTLFDCNGSLSTLLNAFTALTEAISGLLSRSRGQSLTLSKYYFRSTPCRTVCSTDVA
jgi:hypothetical protein